MQKMETYTLDVSSMVTRRDVYVALKALLQLPDYFGGNADALYDCLTERSEPGTLIFEGMPADVEAMSALALCMCVMRDACWTVCGKLADLLDSKPGEEDQFC